MKRATSSDDAFWPIEERPGLLIRRLHQIHVALFADHCDGFDITPLQYSLLSALVLRGEADQTTLAAAVALDRTTTTGALMRLEARGLLKRVTSTADRRARVCRPTRRGIETLARMEASVRAAHEETLAPLMRAEKRQIVMLMQKLVKNHAGRNSPDKAR